MTESACTPHGPSPRPESRRDHPAVVPAEPSAADEHLRWGEVSWGDSYDEDDPSEGVRDQLSAEEISWLYDVEEEPDGPDPDLCPDAYPELDTPVKWPNGDRARAFVSVIKPGSMLAGLLEDCVPDRMEDGALAESLPAWRRIASWAAAGELAAIAELARRRVPQLWDHGDEPGETAGISAEPVMVSREAIEEVALALTLTRWSADLQAHLAVSLTRRLPATLAALPSGDGASDSSGTGPVRCGHAGPVTDHAGPERASSDRWTRNLPEGSDRTGSPPSRPMLSMPGGASTPGCAEIPAGLGPPAGKLRLAVPWRTLMGLAPEPGRLCWIGPVTPQTAREIAAN